MDHYRQVIRDFLAHLRPRAKASLAWVSPGDLISFRDKLRSFHLQYGRQASAKHSLLKQRASWASFTANPVTAVESLRDKGVKLGREPFTGAGLLRLLEVAKEDWHGAILLGVTTGLRLGDATRLCWQSVDLAAGLLRIETAKTGAVVVLPIHADFARWLAKRQRRIGKAPVFPGLAEKRLAGVMGLSARFRDIVEKAGITGRRCDPRGQGSRHQ
jgi:integrase